ncbi:MAG: polysaccharide biosynthesis protein [Clostridia bacterium]|nr:polysaccharide biosynthesis protein [Clostridia bacterium]
MDFLSKLGKSRRLLLAVFDFICLVLVNISFYIMTIIFDNAPIYMADGYFYNAVLLALFMFGFRLVFRVYSNVWRYTSTKAYFNLVMADFCGGITAALVSYAFSMYAGIWHFACVASVTALLAIMSRLSYRLLYKRLNKAGIVENKKIKVAIVGAGQLGASLASDLLNNKNSLYQPLFFIDRDKSKVGSRVYGLTVLHENASVLERIEHDEISEVFIALTDLNSETAARLFDFYSLAGCKIKICDLSVRDAGSDKNAKPTVREFSIEDLLFREPMNVAVKDDLNFYNGKTVLVTGGGGSIGSELCRQLAKLSPKKLIIFDIYENNAYDIQQELIRAYGNELELAVEIGSVRDIERLEAIFANYRPEIVFHAAAHKHVPLMEQSGAEAIKNNVFGTNNTADMAEKYGAERFILISTDKAVNPTNIMGASKRLCEMTVLCRSDSKTSFAAVRFGNVLGSNGSVIPLFKRQIASGGPVTITDKRIIRYFMTIPEASQLVMQAGAMAKKGELFVLDMGKPIRIYDLARNMIKLSGFEPDVDIKIEEIGLRPGEKLYEELLMNTETLSKTVNNMIFIEHEAICTRDEVGEKLAILEKAVALSSCELGSARIKAAIKSVVPTFREPNEINVNAETAKEMQEAQ